jgi:branched-chain amino acid transport system permease protein
MKNTQNRLLLLLFVGVLAVAPLAIYPVFLMEALTMALFAASFNLVFGYSGLLSFGHAAFYGVSAYATAFLIKDHGFSTELALLTAVAISGALGALFGLLALKRRGIYFSMVTLALAEVIYFIALRWPATGGEEGLQGVPRGALFGWLELNDTMTLYYVLLVMVLAALALIHRIIHSPFGLVLRGFCDSEQRTLSLGYEVQQHLMVVMTLSAALAGLAGGLKVLVFQFATLSDLSWHLSGLVVLACLIGGTGTFWGPILGGIAIALLHSLLAESGSWVTLIQGVIFIACVQFFREGFVGTLSKRLRNRRATSLREQA